MMKLSPQLHHLYAKCWILALGIILALAIRFLGIPVIVEIPPILIPEMDLMAHSASLQDAQALFSSNQISRTWGWALVALAIIAIPLYYKKTPLSTLLKTIHLSALAWILLIILSAYSPPESAPQLIIPSVAHLILCWLCFELGYCLLSQYPQQIKTMLWITCIGLIPVFLAAFQQHYGGLAAMRDSVFANASPDTLPEDFVRRLTSIRVYGTMVYPNSLAGLILLMLPACLYSLWELPAKIPQIIRLLLVGILGYMGCAAFFWSGSKTAWLVCLILGIITLFLKAKITNKYKLITGAGILCIGLIAFALTFSDYFKRGATSMSARFTYWNAAALNIQEHPLLGSGPGTFAIPYQKVKTPEDEMARLCHNDYLEQATDSGIPAAIAYLLFIAACFTLLWRQWKQHTPLEFCILLGITGFALQGFNEFSLYIPAIAWPFFILLGFLVAKTFYHKKPCL